MKVKKYWNVHQTEFPKNTVIFITATRKERQILPIEYSKGEKKEIAEAKTFDQFQSYIL